MMAKDNVIDRVVLAVVAIAMLVAPLAGNQR
jgi:hypothetical protein